jgi:hypothetical protein
MKLKLPVFDKACEKIIRNEKKLVSVFAQSTEA